MTEVLVDPTDGSRGLVVVADVTHELASEILYGGEDTSRNNVALNLGKPNLDLIEPAGIGRGVMDANGRISLKEFKNFLGFVGTQVVGNHVDFATCWLTTYDLRKEVDELATGMAHAGFGQHLAGLSVQSAVKRKGSMAVVLEAMSFGPAGRKWQNRVQSIERLDGALLVDAEYSGVQWWFEVQPDDIGGFLFELRIIAGHVAARTVGLQPKLPPYPTDRRLTDTQLLCKPITAPMGRSVGRSAPGQFQNARFGLRSATAMLGAAVARIQPDQSFVPEALLPKADVTIGASEPLTNFTVRPTSC